MSVLRDIKPQIKVETLCSLFGKSRQSYYQYGSYSYKVRASEEIILEIVMEIRRQMPKVGGRKLHVMINEKLPPEMKIGRDSLFDILDRYNLKIHRRIRRVRTTYSDHWMRKYPNKIRGVIPMRANQIWVADITYIQTGRGWVYLHLLTDAYSRMIVGSCVGDSLESKYTIESLKMALKGNRVVQGGLIHHSDRGCQYCCERYVKLLQDENIQISMCETGDPRENAIAERVNGILKMEWLNHERFKDINDASARVKEVVKIYNTQRRHMSLDYRTPEEVHSNPGLKIKRRWNNNYAMTKVFG